MAKRNTILAKKKEEKALQTLVFDQDNAWKNYVEKNVYDCIAVTNPKLYVELDKTFTPEFLEQEMTNMMLGKYKIKGKEKKTDKLVKLRLLTGEYCFIYVHFEFQDRLYDDFPERIFTYRSLIALRYKTQKITTIVIFTGKPPLPKHKMFKEECFGSEMIYIFNCFVIAEQKIEKLLKSDNPFDLAVLAAKYTLNTEGVSAARKRYLFKKKLTALAYQKGFSFEKTEELLSFVLDYMLLPNDMEKQFEEEFFNEIEKNQNNMVATRGETIVKNSPSHKFIRELIAEKAKLLAEKEAEKTKLLAEKEAEKTKLLAEKEAMRQKNVLDFFSLNVPIEKIAQLVERDIDYVKNIIEKKEVQS